MTPPNNTDPSNKINPAFFEPKESRPTKNESLPVETKLAKDILPQSLQIPTSDSLSTKEATIIDSQETSTVAHDTNLVGMSVLCDSTSFDDDEFEDLPFTMEENIESTINLISNSDQEPSSTSEVQPEIVASPKIIAMKQLFEEKLEHAQFHSYGGSDIKLNIAYIHSLAIAKNLHYFDVKGESVTPGSAEDAQFIFDPKGNRLLARFDQEAHIAILQRHIKKNHNIHLKNENILIASNKESWTAVFTYIQEIQIQIKLEQLETSTAHLKKQQEKKEEEIASERIREPKFILNAKNTKLEPRMDRTSKKRSELAKRLHESHVQKEVLRAERAQKRHEHELLKEEKQIQRQEDQATQLKQELKKPKAIS